MLRINAVSSPAYYLSASGEWDRTGSWSGKSADRLGIAGTPDTEAFRRLMANRTPDGQKLTPRDHAERRTGYDLTFSEPKSVSIFRELTGDDRIDRAREESVREVMRSVVEPLAATRERRLFGFRPVETGNLAWLDFHHRLGRPVKGVPEMNGHTHVVIPNCTRSGNRHLALEIRPIKEAAPLIQAAWHASYASKLKGLGYDIRPTKDAFEIAGVHDSTIRKFTGRSELIELEAKRREVRSPKGRAALGALTRERKQANVDPDKLLAAWRDRLTKAEEQALTETHHRAMVATPELEASSDARHVSDALSWHLKTASAVPEDKLLETALRRGVGEVTLEGLRAALDDVDAGDMVRVAMPEGPHVTTVAAMRREKEVLDFADGGAITIRRTKRGERVEARPGETLVPHAEKLGFDQLHALVYEGRPLLLHAEAMRDYRKPARGEVLAVLEDLGKLPTGQKRPGVKLTERVARVGKGLQKRLVANWTWLRRIEMTQQGEGVGHGVSPGQDLRERGLER